MARIRITNDLFDIADRLKSVNPNYIVFYDTERQQYCVFLEGTPPKYAFTVPYDKLDSRAVDYALFTSVKNAEKLFSEMERHNDRLEKENESKSREEVAVAIDKAASAM